MHAGWSKNLAKKEAERKVTTVAVTLRTMDSCAIACMQMFRLNDGFVKYITEFFLLVQVYNRSKSKAKNFELQSSDFRFAFRSTKLFKNGSIEGSNSTPIFSKNLDDFA